MRQSSFERIVREGAEGKALCSVAMARDVKERVELRDSQRMGAIEVRYGPSKKIG